MGLCPVTDDFEVVSPDIALLLRPGSETTTWAWMFCLPSTCHEGRKQDAVINDMQDRRGNKDVVIDDEDAKV